MAVSFGFLSKKIIGINIGPSSIKIIKLAKAGHNNCILEGYDIIDLPAGAVMNGIIKDHASVASYIKNSFVRHGFNNKNVAVSIPCKHVIIKTIEMPKMKKEELDSAIFFEAQQYITYDINEVSFDYVVLGDSPTGINTNMIMIVAGKKDIINDHIQLIHESGLNPLIVDVDCIALENMFSFNYPEEEDQMICLIRAGSLETNVHVINKGRNLFRRDIPMGGFNITEEISKKFQIEFNEAENIKTGGINLKDLNFQTNYAIYLNMIVLRITSEIQRTIDYFAANNDKQYPKKIFLTGGSSKITGLAEGIEAKTNIPVEIANSFRHITFKPGIGDPGVLDAYSGSFGIAVGLAAGGLQS